MKSTRTGIVRLASWSWPGIAVLLLGAVGCGPDPGVTSAAEQTTVHGVIKLRGKPVAKGLIRFQATGRDGAPRLLSAPIGQGGSYKVSTLIGPNSISLVLPEAMKSDPFLTTLKLDLDAKPTDNTFDIDLPPR